jgi:protein-disulfide reductase (glutathione)
MKYLLTMLLLISCRSTTTPPEAPPPKPSEWNDSGIGWTSWAAGKASAAASKKPICLVLVTTWCPHCHNFARLFHDPRVVKAAAGLVMVRVDKDREEELSARYAPDGDYIPRTLFLHPDGTLASEIRANEGPYQWFFAENDPAPLLAAMDRATRLQ